MSRTLRWVLIAIVVLIVLYVIGFVVFGSGGQELGFGMTGSAGDAPAGPSRF